MHQQIYFVEQSFTLGSLCANKKLIFLLEKDTSKHFPKNFGVLKNIYDTLTDSLTDASQVPVQFMNCSWSKIEIIVVKQPDMKEFTVHLVS